MQIWLGVENFAKIEHAKVCMNRYTLLVGQNNSGKTFLMQLMQGVTSKLASLMDVDVMDVFFGNMLWNMILICFQVKILNCLSAI